MNDFEIYADIEIIMELLNITAGELAEQIGVTPITLSRWKKNEENILWSNLNAIYNFAFKKGIRLNKIKEQLFKEDCGENSVILFHGAKNGIEGQISIEKSKNTNDFGRGFYCGESLEQSAMFVASYPESSLYILEFDKSNLSYTKLNVDRDWMLLIAYFRNKLTDYAEHPIILNLLSRLEGVDYIIAPIADNRMFEIIDSDNFGINYDPSHFIWQQIDYIKPLYEFKDKIFHVHYKDIKVYEDKLNDVGIMAYPLEYMSPKLPGYGDVNWGKYVSALTDIGFEGYTCIEVEDKAFESSKERILESVVLSYRYMRQFII